MIMDVCFLDFAQTFDKANYRILVTKVVKQNIQSKLGK